MRREPASVPGIDLGLVGAIVRSDLTGFHLKLNDARAIAQQRLAAAVYPLVERNPESADDEATHLLARAARRAAVHSMMQVAAANGVTKILADVDVPVLIYKGVALAATSLGSWRARESVDVDILIPPHKAVDAHQALVAAGLTRVDGQTKPPGRLFRYHEIELAYSGLPVTIDMHWLLESPGYLDIPFDELWQRRRQVDLDGLRVWTVGAEEAVLISAVHGTREGWRQLRQLLDVSYGLSGMSADMWDRVVRMSSCGATRSLAVALAIAQRCDVPAMPASPGRWAQEMADYFIVESGGIFGRSASHAGYSTRARHPGNALRRRALRWQLAPNSRVAIAGLVRASVRQVLYKRSWNLRQLGSS